MTNNGWVVGLDEGHLGPQSVRPRFGEPDVSGVNDLPGNQVSGQEDSSGGGGSGRGGGRLW